MISTGQEMASNLHLVVDGSVVIAGIKEKVWAISAVSIHRAVGGRL